MINYGTSTIYTSYGADSKKRLPMKVEKAIEQITKKQLPEWRKVIAIMVSGNTPDGIDCILPDIRYQI